MLTVFILTISSKVGGVEVNNVALVYVEYIQLLCLLPYFKNSPLSV